VARDADSVSATISREGTDAPIRVKLAGTQLPYDESARGKGKVDYTGRFVPSTTTTPERCISYLRSDISTGLQKRAAAGPAASANPEATAPKASGACEAPAARGNAVQRMQEVKELLDKGLIACQAAGRASPGTLLVWPGCENANQPGCARRSRRRGPNKA